MLTFRHTNRPVSPQNLKRTQAGLEAFLARTDIGFKDLPSRDALWLEAARVGRALSAKATDIVLIGIGGSSLGPQFLAELSDSHIQVHLADNVDPWQFKKICSKISDWKQTHFLLISKSGSTLETLSTADLFALELEKQGLALAKQAIVITEPRANSLRAWAEQHAVETLEIPLDVGGRFSILSPVGMVLAAALGLSIDDIRAGAKAALADRESVARLSAQALDSFGREEWITFLWSYSSSLRYFGLWFQQLWAESLAKTLDRQGRAAPRVSTPVPAIGTCDQHSLLQQVMDGAKDKWVVQIRVRDCEASGPRLERSQFSALSWLKPVDLGQVLAAEAQATMEALEKSQVSVQALELQDLGPKSIGYLLMYWQLVVACVGESLDLNAFDQPGVELGKRLAKEILQN